MDWTLPIFLAILVFIVFFIAGPRVPINLTLKNRSIPNAPQDIDAYLRQQESGFKNIIPGTEKTIVWADPAKPSQTDFSIIYLHGFSASRQETTPVFNNVAAKLNANIYFTRFKGHGCSGEALARATINDWLNDTQEAFEIGKKIGKKVVLVGVSTGGTLGTWLASRGPEHLQAVVLISPNFGIHHKYAKLLLFPWAKYLIPLFTGRTRHWTPENQLQAKYWTYEYPIVALLPMMGIVNYVSKLDMERYKAPTFYVYSTRDETVDAKMIEKIYNQLPVKNKLKYIINHSQTPSHHVIAGNILSPRTNKEVEEAVIKFLFKAGIHSASTINKKNPNLV